MVVLRDEPYSFFPQPWKNLSRIIITLVKLHVFNEDLLSTLTLTDWSLGAQVWRLLNRATQHLLSRLTFPFRERITVQLVNRRVWALIVRISDSLIPLVPEPINRSPFASATVAQIRKYIHAFYNLQLIDSLLGEAENKWKKASSTNTTNVFNCYQNINCVNVNDTARLVSLIWLTCAVIDVYYILYNVILIYYTF